MNKQPPRKMYKGYKSAAQYNRIKGLEKGNYRGANAVYTKEAMILKKRDPGFYRSLVKRGQISQEVHKKVSGHAPRRTARKQPYFNFWG